MAVAVSSLINDPTRSLYGLSIVAAGVPVYAVLRRFGR
jgi:hypothetical protein